MKGYKDFIIVPSHLKMEDAIKMVDMFREHGSANMEEDRITFIYEEEGEWELRTTLSEMEDWLGSYFHITYEVEKEKVYDI
jgi:hypothetical protein